jgi:hypothetical protein
MEHEENGQTREDKIVMTKERLLKGADLVEEFEIENMVFQIRPLKKGEQAKAEAMAVKGVKASGKQRDAKNPNVEMNMEHLIANDWEVKFYVVACGLSVSKKVKDSFSVNDVKNMNITTEVLDALNSKIRDISGMKEVDDNLDSFPQDDGGE